MSFLYVLNYLKHIVIIINMKILLKNISILIFCLVFFAELSFANDYSKAERLIKKSKTATIKEQSYDYINEAREIYLQKYNDNQEDIKALVGLSKTYQLIGDRKDAKLYLLKAYNMRPYDAKLQREMADFHYSFQEYSTAIEYYKAALASGLLRDFDTNLLTAKCYEKLGDLKNAELYYQICYHLDSKSKKVMNKLNEYDSAKHPDNTQELENAKYKYLFKNKKLTDTEQADVDTEEIIQKLNY